MVGVYAANSDAVKSILCAPGTTVTVLQQTAQTLGAAVVFAEIWGS